MVLHVDQVEVSGGHALDRILPALQRHRVHRQRNHLPHRHSYNRQEMDAVGSNPVAALGRVPMQKSSPVSKRAAAKRAAATALYAALCPLRDTAADLLAEFTRNKQVFDDAIEYDAGDPDQLEDATNFIARYGPRGMSVGETALDAFEPGETAYLAYRREALRHLLATCEYPSPNNDWIPFLKRLTRLLEEACNACVADAPGIDGQEQIESGTTVLDSAMKREPRGRKPNKPRYVALGSVLRQYPGWLKRGDPASDEIQEALDNALLDKLDTDEKQYFMPPSGHPTWLQYRKAVGYTNFRDYLRDYDPEPPAE